MVQPLKEHRKKRKSIASEAEPIGFAEAELGIPIEKSIEQKRRQLKDT